MKDSAKYVGTPQSVAIRIPDCSVTTHLIDLVSHSHPLLWEGSAASWEGFYGSRDGKRNNHQVRKSEELADSFNFNVDTDGSMDLSEARIALVYF